MTKQKSVNNNINKIFVNINSTASNKKKPTKPKRQPKKNSKNNKIFNHITQ